MKKKLTPPEIFILAAVTALLSCAAAYNVYKNKLIELNAEATTVISTLLKAESENYKQYGSFIDINNPAAPGLSISLKENKFFDEVLAVHNKDTVEITLKATRGFFKGSTAYGRHIFRKDTFFEVRPKTKIPLRHL